MKGSEPKPSFQRSRFRTRRISLKSVHEVIEEPHPEEDELDPEDYQSSHELMEEQSQQTKRMNEQESLQKFYPKHEIRPSTTKSNALSGKTSRCLVGE